MATIQTTPEKESKIENSHKISICDITKNNTSEILQKIEGLAAIYLQGYSDLFIKYIHSFIQHCVWNLQDIRKTVL